MMKHATVLALAACASAAHAATPDSGTITLYDTEIIFTEGPNVGVNPTPATSDFTGVQCQNPGVDCDRFALTLDLPENLTDVFPSALLRINLTWENMVPEVGEDYDMYAYDGDGNLIGDSADDNTTVVNPRESITLAALGGQSEVRIDMIYFLTIGSTYTNTVTLDLGPPSEDADVDAFFEANPPPEGLLGFFIPADQDPVEAEARSARSGGGSFGGGLLLALATALGATRRRR